MALVQNLRNRKSTGGRYKKVYSKRLAQKGDLPALTKIDDKKVHSKRTMGGNSKRSLLASNKVNLLDPKTRKATVAEITNVADNKASRHFIRRNIITKGAVIETSKGKAKVTNRPGQEGFINAILVK